MDQCYSFGEVDEKVMRLLSSESHTNFSFQGMKRSLKVHQEKLSRSLSRLVTTGLVGKADGGYAITRKGLKVMGTSDQEPAPLIVVSSYLPRDIDGDSASLALKGRWFSGVRWLGSSPSSLGTDLKWVTDDGETQIKVSFKGRTLDVSLVSFPLGEEARARDLALRLHARIVNALYKNVSRLDS